VIQKCQDVIAQEGGIVIEFINTFEPVIVGVMLGSILSWIIIGITATSSRAWLLFWGLFLITALMVGLLMYKGTYERTVKTEAIENCAETDLYVLTSTQHEGTRLLRIYDCHHVEMP